MGRPLRVPFRESFNYARCPYPSFPATLYIRSSKKSHKSGPKYTGQNLTADLGFQVSLFSSFQPVYYSDNVTVDANDGK